MSTPASAVPRVSIIVPTYNTAQYIGGTLASIFAQTYRNFEVVVVNDGSPDTPVLERVLEPYMDRIIYLTQENHGLCVARNSAIEASRGEYIAFLDSDDEWEPDYLETQVPILDADPSVAVVYPNALIFGDHPHAGRKFMDVCPSVGPVTFQSLLTQRCNVFISALSRREALVRAGLFDSTLRSAEDFELWLRVLNTGGRIVYHDKVLVRFRKRRGSLSADPIWMGEHALAVLEKAERTLNLTPSDFAALQRESARYRAALDLARGKRAFFALDAESAVEHLQRANKYFRSAKISLVCALMRYMPSLMLRMYSWRDRLVLGVDTRF
jgi:glycosyltransferase involved in cell wall biosynthesis